MRVRLSDYIAYYLTKNGIRDVFTITGGGAMYLNDSFGHCEGLRCRYQHHEQACAISGEAYARLNNELALVCVTTGPGGTNAITGVIGGWLDSIPMLIISGQVRSDTMARSTGLDIRSMGDQEFDITKAVSSMTKYCELVLDPKKIKYCLHKAIVMATNGRPGPCWLDIPLDVQSAMIETDDLPDYDPTDYLSTLPLSIEQSKVSEIISKIEQSERPVFYAGNGIRLSGGYELFRKVAIKLNIPIVTNWDSIDLISDDNNLYVGRPGNMGDRAGNFAVQNSDLILSIGSRLSIRQTGFNWKSWAPHAYVIMEDICEGELKKPTLHVDMPLHVDAKVLLEALDSRLEEPLAPKTDWISRCNEWKKKYDVLQPKQCTDKGLTNPYYFMKSLSRCLPEGNVTVVGNGTACVVGSQAHIIKENQRFIINSAVASMGYDLPAAIGACVANGSKPTICITGDGSIMMNLQELQTIVTNRLPIKIFLLNNQGYQSIRITQTNIFDSKYVGIGPDSNDLTFPDFSKIASAFGIPYHSIGSNAEMDELDIILKEDGYLICEVFLDTKQFFEPKSATVKREDGSLYSPPLEDMSPLLPRGELESNMYYRD